ncbi:MAG: hypothetical protein J6T72_02335 [Alphaproteobacteria bacterium]|nr:hypothetical protein [Alphaproteobacteria bacterium]
MPAKVLSRIKSAPKQKQPLLRLFLSARPLEHLAELGSNRAAAKLDAKESLVEIADLKNTQFHTPVENKKKTINK